MMIPCFDKFFNRHFCRSPSFQARIQTARKPGIQWPAQKRPSCFDCRYIHGVTMNRGLSWRLVLGAAGLSCCVFLIGSSFQSIRFFSRASLSCAVAFRKFSPEKRIGAHICPPCHWVDKCPLHRRVAVFDAATGSAPAFSFLPRWRTDQSAVSLPQISKSISILYPICPAAEKKKTAAGQVYFACSN